MHLPLMCVRAQIQRCHRVQEGILPVAGLEEQQDCQEPGGCARSILHAFSLILSLLFCVLCFCYVLFSCGSRRAPQTTWLCNDTGEKLIDEEIETYHVYGDVKVPFTKEEVIVSLSRVLPAVALKGCVD